MKSDSELRSDVENELSWEPSVTPTHLGVAVDGSVVTLSGHVSTWAAPGVSKVENHLTVG